MAVLWRCARQGCFGMAICSPAKSLVWWAEGWLWTSSISGQALLKREQGSSTGWLLQTTGIIADLYITFARPVWVPYVLPWPRQETDGEILSKTDNFTCLTGTKQAWPCFLDFFFFLFLYLYTWICMWIWMSPVTWTLEKADPGEDLRPGLLLLQFQTATSGDWVCSSQLSCNMRRASQDGFEVPY